MSIVNLIKSYYNYIPDWAIKAGASVYYCIPQKFRYGSTFNNTLEALKKNEFISKEEIDELVNKNFLNIVRHAYYNVPFYKEYYDQFGVDISKICSIEDIYKLPFIDKEIVRKNIDKMISIKSNKDKLLYVTTSGSTGNPMGFYQPQSITMTEWAYTLFLWSRVGYRPDSSRLVLRGKKLKNKDQHWYYDPLRRELSCDIFDMREDTMGLYCELIEKYQLEFIHGYMSAITTLAKYIVEKRVVLRNKFKAVLATSENVIEDQKKYVEKVFNAPVFSFYGHSERLVIAGQCECCSSYHVEPSYGYCEIINEQGVSDIKGELVATGFLNYDMPLIRYRTGDFAIKDCRECKCGRHLESLKEITGRWHHDMLINCDGAYVSMTALNIHSDEFNRIIRYKLVQNTKGLVEMQILPMENFSEEDCFRIKKVLEEKVNSKLIFNIKLVSDIPIQKNGKYRIVEQNINK